MRKCDECGFKSIYDDEVGVYDINGHHRTWDEASANNPDAFAHTLCSECAEKFDFKNS